VRVRRHRGEETVRRAEPAGAGAPSADGSPGRSRLAARLDRTRQAVAPPFGRIRGERVDEATLDELEETLLLADVGPRATGRILDALRDRVGRGALGAAPGSLVEAVRAEIEGVFSREDRALRISEEPPSVWLFVGVNGVGKTTTIGKVAAQQVARGRNVVIAAGDTFRAAAGDQLASWAERCGATFVRGADGADPSSVIFDAVGHAVARGADLVLADSAGRLHTKANLMAELRKVRRVADRPPGKLCEVLLVIDATTGQNGLVQAREFANAVAVTGIVLTKLDGTAKGGIVLAIREELGVPIKLVGIGEDADDLVAFDPADFASALVGE